MICSLPPLINKWTSEIVKMLPTVLRVFKNLVYLVNLLRLMLQHCRSLHHITLDHGTNANGRVLQETEERTESVD